MSIALVKKYAPYTDEVMKQESKTALLTNTDFDWTGAHTVNVWKIGTVAMNDYARNRAAESGEDDPASFSRFGEIVDLSAQTEEMMLTKDRSFIFNIDKLDNDETAQQLAAGTALARQLREVVLPEVDTYVMGKMVTKAGTTAAAKALTAANVYAAITAGSEALDTAEAPDTERVLVVTPATYNLMKQSSEILMDSEISAEMRQNGVIRMVDGMAVVKVPANRLPEKFGFMICHPCATVAPVKLEDYGVHEDTVLSSGTIVTGRIAYDAFVLDNKAKAIYYQPLT